MSSKSKAPISLKLEYDSRHQKSLPHVVKFSGGRSSAMMLTTLLEQGHMKPERGDVVVFNNTSAEHPATYDFVRACSSFAEGKYEIPFFWIEFATYEDATKGEWTRRGGYRLVNDKPRSDANPAGYHWKGEVFEELVSHQGFLPSRHTRICTTHLKLRATNEFLSDWFAGKERTARRGHFKPRQQITDKALVERHQKSRGMMDPEELLRKRSFVRSRPLALEEQEFSDFSRVGARHIVGGPLSERSFGDCASMNGANAIEYVSLIGLRADEPRRVARVLSRNVSNKRSTQRTSQEMTDAEFVCAPLADSGITSDDVLAFWDQRSWNLKLPSDANLSNCVFCFMKGSSAIPNVRNDVARADVGLPKELRSVPKTPSDIQWWAELEQRYLRRPVKRSSDEVPYGQERVTIGFWGVDAGVTYKDLAEAETSRLIAREGPGGAASLPCDCTD